jgi:anti-sigma factor (TIGR02949 family)
MTDCRGVLRRLWEYLDGELPRAEADGIRAHLAECARCHPQYRFQLRFLNALITAHAGREVPRPEFVSRLRDALGSADGDLT